MKLAYLGYDRTVFKTYSVLATCFTHIDSYLCDYDFGASDSDFLDLPIMAENVLIPKDVSIQTAKHKHVLKSIENEYQSFKSNIYRKEKLYKDAHASEKKIIPNHFALRDIIRLKFDTDNNKYVIEGRDKDPIQYDYVIIQNHQIVADVLYDQGHNLFSLLPMQSNVLLNLDFAIERLYEGDHLPNECLYVHNTKLKTIFDNWYICWLNDENLRVSLLISSDQYKSQDFIDFIVNRTSKVMSEVFESIRIKEIIATHITATDGFDLQNAKLNYPKYTAVFPSFAYWSQEKINYYIKNMFFAKNRKNQALFYGKESE